MKKQMIVLMSTDPLSSNVVVSEEGKSNEDMLNELNQGRLTHLGDLAGLGYLSPIYATPEILTLSSKEEIIKEIDQIIARSNKSMHELKAQVDRTDLSPIFEDNDQERSGHGKVCFDPKKFENKKRRFLK